MNLCVVRWCLSLGLMMALSGCATARHKEALYAEAHRHIYPQPVEQLWPQLLKLVSAQGYGIRKSEQEFILVTEWRNDITASRVVSSASRLYAEGYRLDGKSCAVRIFRQTVFTGNKGAMTARDNMFTDSLSVSAAGDSNPAAQDGINGIQYVGNAADRTPLTRAPVQTSRSFSRDGELEWELLRFVDEDEARAIEAHITEQERK